MLAALDHVQLPAPPASEETLRAFYTGALGMAEISKPPVLAARGGCWFATPDGGVQLHLGIEDPFRPAQKAHPGLRVTGIDALADRHTARRSCGTTTCLATAASTASTRLVTAWSSSNRSPSPDPVRCQPFDREGGAPCTP